MAAVEQLNDVNGEINAVPDVVSDAPDAPVIFPDDSDTNILQHDVDQLAQNALHDALIENPDDPLLKVPIDHPTHLSDSEKHRIEHAEFHKKHKGHEAMHAEMVIILITMLILGQFALFQWRSKSPKTYNLCTLVLLWIVPVFFSIQYGWTRFLVCWAIFTLINFAILRKSVMKPKISPETPRFVYRAFLFMFRVSLTVGTIGYLCFLFTMLGFNMMFLIQPEIAFDFSFLCLWYGFYFGVVVRDLADLVSTSIAKKVGYFQDDSGTGKEIKERLISRQLAPNICAICGQGMRPPSPKEQVKNLLFDNSNADHSHPINSRTLDGEEDTHTLSCGHTFHEYCVRGWIILGKKQTCPYCSEKVNTKALTAHPWEKYNHMYAQLLEWIRYLVAWQPVILMLVHGVTWLLGLE